MARAKSITKWAILSLVGKFHCGPGIPSHPALPLLYDWHIQEGHPAPPSYQAECWGLPCCNLVAQLPPRMKQDRPTLWVPMAGLSQLQALDWCYFQGHWCHDPSPSMDFQNWEMNINWQDSMQPAWYSHWVTKGILIHCEQSSVVYIMSWCSYHSKSIVVLVHIFFMLAMQYNIKVNSSTMWESTTVSLIPCTTSRMASSRRLQQMPMNSSSHQLNFLTIITTYFMPVVVLVIHCWGDGTSPSTQRAFLLGKPLHWLCSRAL